MAVLQQSVSNSNPFAETIGDALPPVGTFVATVLDVKDEFGVMRRKFESEEMEKVDLTCFLFGFRDPAGNKHLVASKLMRISGNEKSALFGFLKSLLGRAPAYGWDYCELKGSQCLLTVEHIQRRDGAGVFAAIAALSPVPVGMGVAANAGAPAPQARPTAGGVPAGRAAAQPAAGRTMSAPQPAPQTQQVWAAPMPGVGDDAIPF